MHKLDVSIKELREIAKKYENSGLSNMEFLGIPMPLIDCNKCQYISITETTQREEKYFKPHICQFCKERCYHNSREKDAVRIYPCRKCEKDKFKNYIKRIE